MAVEIETATSSRRAKNHPYIDENQRQEFLSECGYGLDDIPQMTGRASSLVRRSQNTIFPTISNLQGRDSRDVSGSRSPVASRPGTRPGSEHAAISRQSVRKTRRDDAEKLNITRPPVSLYAGNGRTRPWIVRFWSKLYPAHETWGTRAWRTAGYLLLCWFVAFWLVWFAINVVNGIQYGPAHTTQETYVVNNIGYSASAYVQNNTVVVTVLEKDGQGWKPVYAMTTPQLDSSYWGTDLSAIVPIITGVSAKGVISIQMIGNIDWRFHRPTKNITLTPQPNGSLALTIGASH